jgi:exodeoxyribonuclease V alpha subunit
MRRSKPTQRSRTAPAPRPLLSWDDLLPTLQQAKFGPTHLQRMTRRYGKNAATIVQTHPYRLSREIAGVSFQMADTVAQRLGRGRANTERVRAGIRTIVQQATRAGHTSLPFSAVLKRATGLLNVSRSIVEEQSLRGALDVGGDFIIEQRGRETFLSVLELKRVEEHVADMLKDRLRMASQPLLPDVDAAIQTVVEHYPLNTEQQHAVRSALTSPLTVVTGGPGTGKTFLCQALNTIATEHQIPVVAAAPTGRAAQRLTEASGLQAKTIHRLLEFQPTDGVFLRNAAMPLATTLVVVDETSMVDLFLAEALLDAIPFGAKLLLIGDPDQLPSVGPGQVLADIIASEVAPVVRLNQLYRQAEQSLITSNAHRIRDGKLPQLSADTHTDFRFIEAADPDQAIERVVELVAHELPTETGLDPHTDIQVLCPMNQGPAGTRVLNKALQQRLNPDGQEMTLAPEQVFRLGDRVLVTQNNYRLGLFNGEVGWLREGSAKPRRATIATDTEEATFVGPEVSSLTLGYAVSVHWAQGGEFPGVVILLHDLHAPLLQRSVLYTALTRAKQQCVIVGTRQALAQAVRNQRSQHRYTGLAAALV